MDKNAVLNEIKNIKFKKGNLDNLDTYIEFTYDKCMEGNTIHKNIELFLHEFNDIEFDIETLIRKIERFGKCRNGITHDSVDIHDSDVQEKFKEMIIKHNITIPYHAYKMFLLNIGYSSNQREIQNFFRKFHSELHK